ncbi:MAG: hypothetical protein M1830_004132 [Pleopsidium flavum]|nr:MAG: hypothetical protein M1830_004132 [Pleopsidium flavum]
MGASKKDLPSGDSPALTLTHPTDAEKVATWKLNGASWRGALSLPSYLRREEHLANQAFTRNGGLTFWILVDGSSPSSPDKPRKVLSSCETLRKRALVADEEGNIEEVVCQGVGSVFCAPELRERGYAGRMMKELGKELERWQQKEQTKCQFTVLYSDIGKEFYARNGWHPFPSSHVALPPVSSFDQIYQERSLPQSRPLYASDLAELCDTDEKLIRRSLSLQPSNKKTRLALVPDVETMAWHHAREEFAANELQLREPKIKGAIVGNEAGKRAWIIWTRTWNGDPYRKDDTDNVLNILRIVVEEEEDVGREDFHDLVNTTNGDSSSSPNDGAHMRKSVQSVASLLLAAQKEATKFDLSEVQAWNPTRTTTQAAKVAYPAVAAVIERDSQSIASLKWYGSGSALDEVEWIGNEKYGWC